jgi:DNA-directed RNA polymerase specialized sigma subunit
MRLSRQRIEGIEYRHPLFQANLPVITQDRLAALIPKINEREAYNEVIVGHVRLSMQIVGRYLRKLGSDRLAEDLVSAAYEGIVDAVDRISKGNLKHDNATAYIVEYIHWHISKVLEKRKIVYVPQSTIRDNRKAGKSVSKPHQIDFSDPSIERRLSVRKMALPDFEIAEIVDKITTSDTERRILELRREGHVDAEIAETLGLAKTSVFIIRKDIEKRFLELMYEQS